MVLYNLLAVTRIWKRIFQMSKEDKKAKMMYAMSLTALEDFCMEAEEQISIFSDVIRDYLNQDSGLISNAVLSTLCQGLTLSQQMLEVAGATLEDPIFVKDSKEKIVVMEEDMYLIETIALSKLYCENQLRKLSISTKMN